MEKVGNALVRHFCNAIRQWDGLLALALTCSFGGTQRGKVIGSQTKEKKGG